MGHPFKPSDEPHPFKPSDNSDQAGIVPSAAGFLDAGAERTVSDPLTTDLVVDPRRTELDAPASGGEEHGFKPSGGDPHVCAVCDRHEHEHGFKPSGDTI